MTRPRRADRHLRPRWAVHGLALATALSTLAVPSAAVGTPDTGGTPTTSATSLDTAGGRATVSATLTLITGHVVEYTESLAGQTAVTVLSTPPGEAATIETHTDPTGVYAVPTSARSLVAGGVLDRELFDVQYLAHHGYGDDEQRTLPVIVSYQPGAKARAAAPKLAGTARRSTLESLSGEGLTVTKSQAPAFWAALTAGAARSGGARATAGATTLANGVRKVWLDRKVRVNLDESVSLIGAPSAWAAGYDGSGVTVAVLDTGIDANHPDLAGRVVDSRSFIPGVDTVADGHGHGTHVAATIAGSGAASAGRRKGVAPGADLIVGKVLGDDGSGDMSLVIDGMEWAANSGARVISMSLSSPATDGTDAASLAVDSLSASTGALFVIAAGNSGPGQSTVGAPGVADAALTVAMTSKSDQLDSRSSRGPRRGDGALKPDIAAPGVDIVAARAAGTSMGSPVDQHHTSASGTSMATPHVAGAAAILAQRHPDWTPGQIKSTLMSTAKDIGFTAYEVGAGRLDLARALTQKVAGTTPNVDFGTVSPTDTPRLTKQIGYANSGDQPVTLTLTPTLRGVAGESVPAGTLTADASVTVPAGGSATATVTVDVTSVERGQYTGSVVAVDEATGIRLTTPVGLLRQPPQRRVDMRIVGRPGEPLAQGGVACTFRRVDDTAGPETHVVLLTRDVFGPNVAEGSGHVPDGTYNIGCSATWSERDSFIANAMIQDPESTVSGDATFEWNLATAVQPIQAVRTPLPSESVQISQGYSRTTASGGTYTSIQVVTVPYGYRFYVTPSAKRPVHGSYRHFFEQVRAAPEAVATVRGNGRAQVRPVYLTDNDSVPKFDTDRRLRLATEADLRAGKDVRGRLVVVDSEPFHGIQEEVDLATEAGAAGVLNHVVGETVAGFGTTPFLDQAAVKIPVLWLDRTQWTELARVLAGADRPYVDIRSQLDSPYEYNLRYYTYDRIPTTFAHAPRHGDLVARQTGYHSQTPAVPGQPNAWKANHTYAPGDTFSANNTHWFDAPVSRTEYYTVTGPQVRWARSHRLVNQSDPAKPAHIVRSQGGFSTPGRDREALHQGPVIPSLVTPGPGWDPDQWVSMCPVCRQGDTLYVYPDTAPSHDRTQSASPARSTVSYSLTRDGVQVPGKPGAVPTFALDAEPATYALRTVFQNGFSGHRFGKRVSTDWTFRSGHVGADTVTNPYTCVTKVLGVAGPCGWQPLIQLTYGLDLALDDTAEAGRPFAFTVRPWQPGQADPAPVAGVTVRVSYDDGRHWADARLRRQHDGSFSAQVRHPRLDRTTGAVTIRTEAWDTAGNRVVQQIDRAYGLTGGQDPDQAVPRNLTL
ncbi:S8 family serine peptidase [Micromonospora sp. NPDC047074]|uniref:S8 family serine peptidase n=1 Tax=Micromonospora sp. NPDC047074 TaxID=3154339 RepID=UPI0033CC8FD1